MLSSRVKKNFAGEWWFELRVKSFFRGRYTEGLKGNNML